jgi:predicted tellurium resistance membrane protein TerC
MVAVPLFFEISNSQTSAPLLLVTHAAIFAGLGAAAGAGLVWAWGDRKVIVKCAAGGILGAVIATLLVDVINVASFGVMRIFEPVPAARGPRIVVHLGIALGIALFAARAGRKLRPGRS